MVSKSHSAWSFSSILPPIQNTCLSSLPSEITGFLRVGEGLTFLFKLLAPALSGVQHRCSVSLTIGTPPDFPGTLALPSVVPSPVEGSGLGWLVWRWLSTLVEAAPSWLTLQTSQLPLGGWPINHWALPSLKLSKVETETTTCVSDEVSGPSPSSGQGLMDLV